MLKSSERNVRVMELGAPGEPLRERERPPLPLQGNQVRIAISACAVCRTDLHVMDGELPNSKLPIVPGHEIIGRVAELGADVRNLAKGDRIGVPWLGWACGACAFCLRGEENLCPHAKFTGYEIDGGYATETIADARFVFPVPANYSDEAAAPLMCAGLIGWRCLKMAGNAKRLGLYGFGAAAHLIAQVANGRRQQVFAFVSPGDKKAKTFAREMGAQWAGDSTELPPAPLDAAIIFAPVGALVPLALRAIRPGGTVVCGGIHMSEIPSFPYEVLWGERVLRSVANLTRKDAEEFLAFAGPHTLRTATTTYPLSDANHALADLRAGRLSGAAVLMP
jgi:propanol-preferring alcohol dehydrogenase